MRVAGNAFELARALRLLIDQASGGELVEGGLKGAVTEPPRTIQRMNFQFENLPVTIDGHRFLVQVREVMS